MDKQRGFYRLDNDDQGQAKPWGLPEYSDTETPKATALNYSAESPIQPETDVLDDIAFPTVEEIEAIKQDAFQEGLMQGQEAGFKQGYDKGKAQGLIEGQSEGIEQGQQQGYAETKEQMEQVLSSFASMMNQLSNPMAEINQEIESQLLEMVLAIAKEVAEVELQTNPDCIANTIQKSIQALPIVEDVIQIRIHPDSMAMLEEANHTEEYYAQQCQIHADTSINVGDIAVQAGNSHIDLQVTDRINKAVHQFLHQNYDVVTDNQQDTIQASKDQVEATLSSSSVEPLKDNTEVTDCSSSSSVSNPTDDDAESIKNDDIPSN
ncbi:flagellar assembly protein FliH [Vibrio sp.]|nr:flagellar assembly protein FliH [Vibrio sp.]